LIAHIIRIMLPCPCGIYCYFDLLQIFVQCVNSCPVVMDKREQEITCVD